MHRIYRGSVASSDFWYITAQPSSGLGCDDYLNWAGDDAYFNWQQSDSSTYAYRTGNIHNRLSSNFADMWAIPPYADVDNRPHSTGDGFKDCRISTDEQRHGNCCVDSSVPVVKEGNTARLFGWASGQMECGLPLTCITIVPAYEGIGALDAYWETHGVNNGAYVCIDAACTEQP